MMTFTAMFFSVSLLSKTSNRGALRDFDSFRRVLLPVVVQSPGRHIRRLAAHHAYDDVAVPGPGMIAVKQARPRGVVRVRMIPANHVESAVAGGFLGRQDVFRGNRETVARGIIAAVYQRKQLQNFALTVPVLPGKHAVASEQCPTAFVGKGFRAVLSYALRQLPDDVQLKFIGHRQSSSQKRSLQYFAAESARTVTRTAGCPGGSCAATFSVPNSAPAALGLTRSPSSRAKRLTMR